MFDEQERQPTWRFWSAFRRSARSAADSPPPARRAGGTSGRWRAPRRSRAGVARRGTSRRWARRPARRYDLRQEPRARLFNSSPGRMRPQNFHLSCRPACRATLTFSSAVRLRNRFETWNVRDSPRRASACGPGTVMSLAEQADGPLARQNSPAMSRNRVVFPAPFGPITATRSSGPTSKLTPSTAVTPPKRWTRFSMTSGGAPPPAVADGGALGTRFSVNCPGSPV